MARLLFPIVCSISLLGCGGTPTPTTAPAPSASAASPGTPPGAGWEGGKWARFHSLRHDAWLTLPDGPTWKIDDHKGSWLTASHTPTTSTLAVRLFRENEPMNREKCEAIARKADATLPVDDPKTRVDSRKDDVLPGWDGYEFAVVTPVKSPGGQVVIHGELVAFAARIHNCFVLRYGTSQSGPGAESMIAARLADMNEVTRKITFEDEREGPGRIPLPR